MPPEYDISRRNERNAGLDNFPRRESASAKDVSALRRRLDALEERARHNREESERFASVLVTTGEGPLLSGHATREGVNRFAASFGRDSTEFYRAVQDVFVSSLGIGTNRGALDGETDISYARAVYAALQGGINLIDTSLNYRRQRSERAVAAGLRFFIENGGGARDGIVLCSKSGFLVPGAFAENILNTGDVTGDKHCMSPAFLADQLERSRRNLGLRTIDIYYLHNPEIQLKVVKMPAFINRIQSAFDELERAVSDGRIRYYGTATWDGFRTGVLSLRALVEAARRSAGDSHHFRFVQLPFNYGMQEALTRRVEGGATLLDVAAELGITVIASAPLSHGRLAVHSPTICSDTLLSCGSDTQRAIQFVRSTPGISSALVGMRDASHVVENLGIAKIPPLASADLQRLSSRCSSELPRRR
jgi:aryl-alcohol dehydrogenase-like predicted oxidoreductase